MRLPRLRLTIWQLMISVAIVGVSLALTAEQERFRRIVEPRESLAAYRESRTAASIACSRTTRCVFTDHGGRTMTGNEVSLNRVRGTFLIPEADEAIQAITGPNQRLQRTRCAGR